MSKVVITKDGAGKLRGFDEASERAYAKWRRMVAELPVGQTLSFSWRMPRSPEHHGLFFHKLRSLLGRTEAFDSLDHLRYWLVMGAGYCDFVPGLDGQPNAIPRSIDFETLDEAEFCELHQAVQRFLWTAHAQRTLWPALDAEQQYRCMESFVEEFE